MNNRKVYDSETREANLVDEVSIGVTLDGLVPDSVPEIVYDEKGRIICDKNPEFHLVDRETGERYKGYIKKLNPKDFENKPFNLIIRGMNKEGILFAEERVEKEDLVHLEMLRLSQKHKKPYCRFLSYDAFVEMSSREYGSKESRFVFGKVKYRMKNHKTFGIDPIRFVSEDEFRGEENRIIRASDDSQ